MRDRVREQAVIGPGRDPAAWQRSQLGRPSRGKCVIGNFNYAQNVRIWDAIEGDEIRELFYRRLCVSGGKVLVLGFEVNVKVYASFCACVIIEGAGHDRPREA